MFNFMKKDKSDGSKEKKKEKKKDRPLTSEDLNRLEEVRRSYFGRKQKPKPKPTKDGAEGGASTATSPSAIEPDDSSTASVSPAYSPNDTGGKGSEFGAHNYSAPKPKQKSGSMSNAKEKKPPAVPPKPPKRDDSLAASAYGTEIPYGSSAEKVASIDRYRYDVPPVRTTTSNGLGRPLPPLPCTVAADVAKSPVSTSSEYSSAAQSPAKSPMEPAAVMEAGEGVGDANFVKVFPVELKLPPVASWQPPKARMLTLARQPAGDFGFCLRRAFADHGSVPFHTAASSVVVNGDASTAAGKRRECLFAEPKEFSRSNPTGLLPGDRLLEVNGTSVVEKTREEVADLIRASGEAVTLTVQPVPELSELTVRSASDGTAVELDESHIKTGTLTRSGSKRLKKAAAKSENQIASEKAWLDVQRVWVVHKGGYASASLLDDAPTDEATPAEGRVKVKLEPSGEVIEVDDEDIEKANPPQFDRVEDLAQLRHLNESSVLHTLRQRYASSLIHTYASSSIVVVNPMRPLSIYTEKVIQMFKGCKRDDMPPHIHAVAQSAYRNMLTTRMDQSIVLLGRSGSGKSVNFYHLLSYLCHVAGTVNKVLTVEKLRAINTLLECFGHCRTSLNTNATRYTVLFSLDFEHSGQIANASLQVFMLDKDRVVHRPEGEANFKIFYHILAGMDDKLKKELFLDRANESNLFFTSHFRNEDIQQANINWVRAQGSLEMLGVKEEESKAIWSVLAAIYHLGAAGVETGANGKGQFANPQSAQRAAILLGRTIEDLARAIFQTGVSTLIPPARNAFRTSPTDKANQFDRPPEALEALEGMAVGLYCEVFNSVLSLISRSISSNVRTVSSILLVDSPGFQNPASCGRHDGATFQDLCHNYIQERLQLLFHDHSIVSQQDKYTQERIEYSLDEMDSSSAAAVVNLIDKPSQQGIMRASNLDLRNVDHRGLLWLLDEEAIFPGSSDESFLERLFLNNADSNHQRLLQKSSYPMHFVLQHLKGTNPVLYNADGWLKSCRETPNIRAAILLLQDSQKENISKLFVTSRGAVSLTMSGSVVGTEGTSSLRRASSIRRTYTTGPAGVKRKSICLQLKFQVDGIVETLRRTRLHFVHCLLPQHNAGLCELKTTLLMPSKTSSSEEILMNVPLIRSQIRGASLLDAVRLHKQGFPDHMLYSEFKRRFEILAPLEVRQSSPILDEKKAVEILMENLDIDKTQYRFGLSQIFFRTDALLQLEEQRDERLHGTIIHFQAFCRGYLARKKLAKLKVQDVAIRCVQRNVRKFMAIRSWPWWRLLVKVLPLLNVHRMEEELRTKSDELENLKVKVEKLEKERNELKHENNKLETKVSELTADLAEEHSTSTHASEMLEAETAERMRLEKELQETQNHYGNLQQLHERMEMEVMEVRMLQATEMNGDLSADDDDTDTSIYKQRYENTRRELEFTKKKMQQQIEDDLEQHVSTKKSLERKLSEALDESEQHRQMVNQWKRKLQRLTQEMNDVKYMLEEQTARNAALEKKQRKFDADLSVATDEIQKEKLLKERIQRERDQISGEKYSLEQEIQSVKLELEMKDEKLQALTRELDDLTFGNKGDEEIMHLKRAKHELELKIKEQEEELDDLAGQVQLLEQAKLRLEMNLENVRKEHRKEISQKDEEIEETRSSCQKKLKLLENQLESEHDDRQALIREKHELERKIAELQDRPVINHDAETVHRLRKDLKRTKALLKDAQMMLERSKEEAPSKAVIRQLRNQLEDAEFAKTAAIKARQGAEMELQEAISQLEDSLKAKTEMEKKLSALSRERHDLQAHLEENEEELAEVMKKYKASVAQLSTDQLQLSELASQVSELELERNMLREQLSDMTGKLEQLEGETVSPHEQRRLELKVRELETRLELEATTRGRLEVQLNRMRETVEKLTEEGDALRVREQHAQEANRRLQRQSRDAKEDYAALQQKELEASRRRHELEMALASAEAEIQTIKSDLKLALKRIEDLQAAMEDNADSNNTDSGSDSESSDSSMENFIAMRRPRPSLPRDRLASGSSALSGSIHGRTSSIDDEVVVSSSNAEDVPVDAQSQMNLSDAVTQSQESVV